MKKLFCLLRHPIASRLGLLLTLVGIVIYSLGNTAKYYFYSDDYSVIYHVQQRLAPAWPYGFLLPFYRPLYMIFGAVPEAFTVLGIITYILASISVYIFIKILTKVPVIALCSAMIYATGYIGIEQFSLVTVASVNNINIIIVCLTLSVFLSWLETERTKWYFLSIILFWLGMATLPFRAFVLLVYLPVIAIIKIPVRKFVSRAPHFIPFIAIAYMYGIFAYGTKENSVTVVNNFSLLHRLSQLANPSFIQEFFSIFGKLLLVWPYEQLYKSAISYNTYVWTGVAVFGLVTLFSAMLIANGKYRLFGKNILVALIFTVLSYIGNMIVLLNFNSAGATNRYLNISFVGFSALISILVYTLFILVIQVKNWTLFSYVMCMLCISLGYSSLSIAYVKNIIRERSNPSRKFFQSLKTYVPSVFGETHFYIESANYHPFVSRFGNILQGAYMPSKTALAVHYNVPLESIIYTGNFESFISEFKKKHTTSTRTFFYGDKGLIDTTGTVQTLLAKGVASSIGREHITYGSGIMDAYAEAQLNMPSVVPTEAEITLSAFPIPKDSFNYPIYRSNTLTDLQKEIQLRYHDEHKDKLKYVLQYLSARRRYFDTVQIKASSYNSNFPDTNLTDKSSEFRWWVDDESSWQIGLKPWIHIDLGEQRTVSKILLIQESQDRFPTDIRLEGSSDNDTWRVIGNLKIIPSESGGEVLFPAVGARFLKIHILSTASGATPALSKIEVVDNGFQTIDQDYANRMQNDLFKYVADELEYEDLLAYLRNNAVVAVYTKTDHEGLNSKGQLAPLPIILDGLPHTYTVPIAARGTKLERLRIEANFPSRLELHALTVRTVQLNEYEM